MIDCIKTTLFFKELLLLLQPSLIWINGFLWLDYKFYLHSDILRLFQLLELLVLETYQANLSWLFWFSRLKNLFRICFAHTLDFFLTLVRFISVYYLKLHSVSLSATVKPFYLEFNIFKLFFEAFFTYSYIAIYTVNVGLALTRPMLITVNFFYQFYESLINVNSRSCFKYVTLINFTFTYQFLVRKKRILF